MVVMNISEHGALHGMTYGCWAMGEFGLPRPARFHGQFGEDWFCWELLGRPRIGYFVEAGAYNGVDLSTTLGLQDCGWRGVLVEPLVEQYGRLVEARRVHGVECVNAALVGPEDPATWKMRVSDHEVYGGMTSGVVPETEETLTWEEREVPTTTLGALHERYLKPYGARVDVLFLDVEGGEARALRGLGGMEPRIICAEDLSLTKGGECFQGLEMYMRIERPVYVEFARVGYNRVYVHREMLEAAKKRFHGVGV